MAKKKRKPRTNPALTPKRHYRFHIIKCKVFGNEIIQALDYKYIRNPHTGGDDDHFLIDTKSKMYTFLEHGHGYTSSDLLFDYDNETFPNLINILK